MTNLARFTIAGTPSSQGRYDVATSETPSLQLEQSSQLVWLVTFEVHSAASSSSPRATAGAPTLTLNNGAGSTGQSVNAATPASQVTISSGIPGTRTAHVWEVRCKVNGGQNPDGTPNPDYVFSRFVAMRSSQGLRKLLGSERSEYDPIDSWAGAINELIDLWSTSGGSVDPTKLPLSALGTGSVTLTTNGHATVTVTLPSGASVFLVRTTRSNVSGDTVPLNISTSGFELQSSEPGDRSTFSYLWIKLP